MTHKDQTPLAQIAAEKIIEMIREEKLQPGDRLQNEYDWPRGWKWEEAQSGRPSKVWKPGTF